TSIMRLNWIGRPTSSVSVSASSSPCASIRSASLLISRARSSGLTFDHGPSNALRAAATAASTSASPALATSASFSPVEGSSVAKVSPLAASRQSPPISILPTLPLHRWRKASMRFSIGVWTVTCRSPRLVGCASPAHRDCKRYIPYPAQLPLTGGEGAGGWGSAANAARRRQRRAPPTLPFPSRGGAWEERATGGPVRLRDRRRGIGRLRARRAADRGPEHARAAARGRRRGRQVPDSHAARHDEGDAQARADLADDDRA